MKLLLLSLGLGAVTPFLDKHVRLRSRSLRLGYLPDAARPYQGLPFVAEERQRIEALGHTLVEVPVSGASPDHIAEALAQIDAIYVAGGSTFALLEAVRSNGADRVLVERVRAGLPYIGASAGSILAGPNIEPASLLDDPSDAPGLPDYRGLDLVDTVIVPHADGQLEPYPPELIARTIATYGQEYRLTPLRDDQALLVDENGSRLVDSPG